MILRVLLFAAAAFVLSSCTSTSDGTLLKDRPVSTQGKVKNGYDYLT